MRSYSTLALLAGLMLAASGCDRQSGQATQGAPNAAAANNSAAPDEATSDEATADEATGDEAAPSAAAKDGGEAASHVVDRSHKGEAMPDKAFIGLDGKETRLTALAGGKPMLVNLWATWCAPCIAELPALDRIAASAAAKGIAVVAVSQDQEGKTVVPPFWAARKLAALKTWLDPENGLGFHYATGTLPTTILYDKAGKEVARIVGPVDWQGAEGQALLRDIGA